VKEVLNRVVRDGHLASDVIASVRAMIKKDAQPKTLLSVNGLIEEVVGHLQDKISSEQVSLQMELADGAPEILADRVQLEQVILNLTTNAVDAMREQDGPRLLRISSAIEEENTLVVAIADTGKGIDPQIADRIFDPFFTTKSSGMGLGLAICRSIIEAHGGRLWASPNVPRGTVFRFTLLAATA
jgi:signal transduction histidine kinase